MRFLNFGRVVDTTVLREEFGYTPRYTTEAALADYARTVSPVLSPHLLESATSGVRSALERVGDTASTVGRRLRPSPPAPGLRAVRDA
jgi:UDP-glucose 4-epimerase